MERLVEELSVRVRPKCTISMLCKNGRYLLLCPRKQLLRTAEPPKHVILTSSADFSDMTPLLADAVATLDSETTRHWIRDDS